METENSEGKVILCNESSYVWINMVQIHNIYIDDDDDVVNVENFAMSE